jgi:hypothetical protein
MAKQSQFQSLLNAGSLDKLRTAFKSATTGKFEDVGYWKMTPDKAGNASAVIRFLPAPPPESIPFASFYRHSFKGPNGWYMELSRTTIGEQDPLSEFNSKLWNLGDENIKNQVRNQKRKQTYVSNIYVVQDKAKPENEGKVFLYRYGQKIFDMIQKCLEPEFEGDVAFDPFHPISGANLRLRQKKQQNFPNYDDSKFDSPKALLDGKVEALEAVFGELKSLTDIVSPDKFKSYDELKKKLDGVFGFDTAVYLNAAQAASDTGMRVARPVRTVKSEEVAPATRWVPPTVEDDSTATDDTDDRLSAFDED